MEATGTKVNRKMRSKGYRKLLLATPPISGARGRVIPSSTTPGTGSFQAMGGKADVPFLAARSTTGNKVSLAAPNGAYRKPY